MCSEALELWHLVFGTQFAVRYLQFKVKPYLGTQSAIQYI